MNIVTISREFGSGGRELGKRLADELGVPCYDDEIIELAADRQGISKDYAAHMSEKSFQIVYPSTIAHRFAGFAHQMHPSVHQSVQFAVAQQQVIKDLVSQGNCVVVGRCADIILKDMNPLNLFVYASQESKLARCISRMKEDEHYSPREIVLMMKRIDKDRKAYRELLSDEKWGNKESYHLCVNTSNKEIKKLVPGLAAYIKCWFGESVRSDEV